MEDAIPEHACNPLSVEIRKVANRLQPVASHLEGNNKFVSVVISTQGVPTNEKGEKGSLVLKEYLKSLVELASLPVKLVFRICSDDDAVLEFYNVVDTKVDSDVLDDFWAEVRLSLQLLYTSWTSRSEALISHLFSSQTLLNRHWKCTFITRGLHMGLVYIESEKLA